MSVEAVEIESFMPVITAEDERKIGQLAINSRLLREAVLVWMEEADLVTGKKMPRCGTTPQLAYSRFLRATEDLLGLEPVHIDPHYKGSRRRRR